jgi:hypothetical protein
MVPVAALALLVGTVASGCGIIGKRQPRSSTDIFSLAQWQALAAYETQSGDQFGRLRAEGFGLVERPGYIPLDEHVLERVTFVGAPVSRLDRLLGPNGPSWIPNQPFGETSYSMYPFVDGCHGLVLRMKFEANSDFVPVVVSETLERRSYCVS